MDTMLLGWISHWELLIVAGVILLLFGGARLPSLMRNMGRSVTEFKKGMTGIEEEMNRPVEDDAVKTNEQEKVET